MSGVSDWFDENLDGLSQGGDVGVGTALGGADLLIGLLPGTLDKILDVLAPGFIDDTLGAVFANNMDWSCWGSASNPAEQEVIISETTNAIIENFRKVNQNTSEGLTYALNSASRVINFEFQYYQQAMKRKTSWAKCTKKAWFMHVEAFQKLKVDLIEGVVQKLISDGLTVGVQTLKEPLMVARDDFHPEYDNTTAEKNDAMYGGFTYDVYTIGQNNIFSGGTLFTSSLWWMWILFPIGFIVWGVKYFKGNKSKKYKYKNK